MCGVAAFEVEAAAGGQAATRQVYSVEGTGAVI